MATVILRAVYPASRSFRFIAGHRLQYGLYRPRPSFMALHQYPRFFTKQKIKISKPTVAFISQTKLLLVTSSLIGGSLIYILYRNDTLRPLSSTEPQCQLIAGSRRYRAIGKRQEEVVAQNTQDVSTLPAQDGPQLGEMHDDESAWTLFISKFATFTSFVDSFTDINWASIPGSISDFVVPEWTKFMPDYINKLQRELSMAPGSLADEIWQEAHDRFLNPEIERSATVRVSDKLCDEEKDYLIRRRKVTTIALARYLGLPEKEVHPDDVPCIALVGSGGGFRALIAGTASFLATTEAGLFDCATYTAGVSGSCWLQALYHSSLGGQRFDKLVDHLKARIGTHIASPVVALNLLNSAPTNKYLLRGLVEKLKGDQKAEFGLVDVYGILLAARLMVPKGELEVNDNDLKVSHQRMNLRHGETPLPIYCTVRHEIPISEKPSKEGKIAKTPSDSTKEKAKRENWFQWFEVTPYEFFCEEFNAGIPTWAVGRRFDNGQDVPQDGGLRVPEVRLPLLLGIFGSAFCATLNLYYKEIRPMINGLAGFNGIDEMIQGRNDELSKVHPIDPASIPNPFIGMKDDLPKTTPESIYKNEHLQLMDAGMSNNLPLYPLLRPGRTVDVIIAFDASADIKKENWLSVADGYARQRGIKGWPIGAGWPKESDTAEKAAGQLGEAQAVTAPGADDKVEEAKDGQEYQHDESVKHNVKELKNQQGKHDNGGPGDLGFCTVWVGTTQERENTDTSTSPPPKAAAEEWQLMEPDAGITVVYFPFLSNPKVEHVDPVTAPYMSTWNFIYTPEDIDNIVRLARANFEEGRERTRRTIRAVYERKKRLRQEREKAERYERFQHKKRLGIVGRKGEGHQFS